MTRSPEARSWWVPGGDDVVLADGHALVGQQLADVVGEGVQGAGLAVDAELDGLVAGDEGGGAAREEGHDEGLRQQAAQRLGPLPGAGAPAAPSGPAGGAAAGRAGLGVVEGGGVLGEGVAGCVQPGRGRGLPGQLGAEPKGSHAPGDSYGGS
ncbi:hypothetical protein GCM10020000_48030 [Streptomyces olivoverticillatus]